MPVSVGMLGNGFGTDAGVDSEVEAVAVTENWVKRMSEANGLTLAGFRDFFGGAGFAEALARMSAELLGCLGSIVIACTEQVRTYGRSLLWK